MTAGRYAPVIWLLVFAAGLVACSTPAPAATWRFTQVELPSEAVPRTLAVLDGELLVAGQDGAGNATLHLLREGRATTVPLTTATAAAHTDWTSVVTSGHTVAALGGTPGGAHGNVRWTVWSGDSDGVSEQEQLFETFGGWGAGHLVGLVAAPDGEVGAIGSWASAAGGEDIAVWRREGSRYLRLPSEGTSLASTPAEQINPVAAVGVPDGVVIVGNATVLGRDIRVAPALWHAPALAGPWSRVDLPTNSRMARARAVSCASRSQCAVLGMAGDVLAGWQLDGTNASPVDVPELQAAARESTAVVPEESDPLGLVVSDGLLRAFRVGSGSAVLGPPARGIQAAARLDESIYVVVQGPSGTPTLLRGAHG